MNAIPEIKIFKVGNDVLDVGELLKHPFEDIREASEKLPSAMAWLSWQRAYFKEQAYLADVGIKEVKGRIYHNYKIHGLEVDGYAGKPTEAAIEHAVDLHPDLAAQYAKVAKNERIVQYLTGYINALTVKIELVRTGEATHRKAAEHEPLSDEEIENLAQTKTEGEK